MNTSLCTDHHTPVTQTSTETPNPAPSFVLPTFCPSPMHPRSLEASSQTASLSHLQCLFLNALALCGPNSRLLQKLRENRDVKASCTTRSVTEAAATVTVANALRPRIPEFRRNVYSSHIQLQQAPEQRLSSSATPFIIDTISSPYLFQ